MSSILSVCVSVYYICEHVVGKHRQISVIIHMHMCVCPFEGEGM